MRNWLFIACLFLAACATGPLTAKQQVAVADSIYQEAVRQAINARDEGRLVPGTPAYENVNDAILTGDLLLTQAWQLVAEGAPSGDPALAELLRSISNVSRTLRLEIEGAKNVSDSQHLTRDRDTYIFARLSPDAARAYPAGAV